MQPPPVSNTRPYNLYLNVYASGNTVTQMNAIKRIRTEVLKVTQEDFASAARVTQPTVSRWENNDGCPSLDEIKRICTRYPTVTPSRFFERGA